MMHLESVPRQVLVIFPTCLSICQVGVRRGTWSVFTVNMEVMMVVSLLFGKHL